MNTKAILGILAAIIALPIIYILSGFYTPAPTYAFRGLEIKPIEPSQGELTVPTVAEDEQGATMHAVFKPGYVEKITGVKSPNPAGLDLVIDATAAEIGSCTEKGKIPPKAEFNVAKSCAEKDFANWQAEKKTTLLVDPDQKLIVFGASGNNMARVYHNGMIASYISPDMLQSDRKREACIVSAMLDSLLGFPQDPDASCAAIK
jgi:hypothetical protein